MKVLIPIAKISLLIASLCLSVGHCAAAPKTARILFFSKSSGYEHSAIKEHNGQLSAAETVLQELGKKNNIDFTFSKDGSLFTPEYLAQFDAFFFYTTGDLTEKGTDGNPPMSPEGKVAFLDAIKHGKGFIGTHSAADTFHSPGGKVMGPARYQNDGDKADEYIKMLGGEFIIHGNQQPAHMLCVDRKFPGTAEVPADFGPKEEWYSLKNFAPDLHVLFVQDTGTMEKGGNDRCYDRPPYPATWAHHYGKGRVFYTNMGHREDVWSNPAFQQVLMGGIDWAVGRVKADVTPNLKKVTPQADVLPPQH